MNIPSRYVRISTTQRWLDLIAELVRRYGAHVSLGYGQDAEVVGPAEVQGWVVEAVSGLDASKARLAVEGV